MKMNQRKATVYTILAVLEERGEAYELNGSKAIAEILTDADKKAVRDALFSMFRSSQVEMAEDSQEKYADDGKLKNYIGGLVNNWIRKAPEFNCGGKYTPKNPGSRVGSGDEQIREMKKLLSSTADAETKAVIQSHIDSRLAEIKPTTQVTVDASKLPESLRHLVK